MIAIWTNKTDKFEVNDNFKKLEKDVEQLRMGKEEAESNELKMIQEGNAQMSHKKL